MSEIYEEEMAIGVNLNGYKVGAWTSKNVVINLSGAVDSKQKYQYSTDGTQWTDCSSTITLDQNQNKNYIFRIIDDIGNVKATSNNYSIKIDKVKPVLEIENLAGEITVDTTIKTANDNGSGLGTNPIFSYYYKYASDSDDKYILDYKGTDRKHTISNLSCWSSYIIKVTVQDLAGNIGEAIGTAGTSCFVAGTKVLTENGMRNIEDIKVGDKVYALNIDTNKKELKKVENLFRGYTDEIYELTIGEEIVKVTPKHQFYIQDKGWIRAYDLKEGDKLVAKDNQELVINKIVHKIDRNNPIKVYNLTVEGYHTYLITQYEVLVHNATSQTRE